MHSNFVSVSLDYLLWLYGGTFGKIVVYSEVPANIVLNDIFPLDVVAKILNFLSRDSCRRFLSMKGGYSGILWPKIISTTICGL